MSCCGRGSRSPGTIGSPRESAPPPGGRGFPASQRAHPVVYFRYVGRTSLVARGPVTRRSYRFAGPGAVLGVDRRDAHTLVAIPRLERLASSGARTQTG